jgi:hypothetical protein
VKWRRLGSLVVNRVVVSNVSDVSKVHFAAIFRVTRQHTSFYLEGGGGMYLRNAGDIAHKTQCDSNKIIATI